MTRRDWFIFKMQFALLTIFGVLIAWTQLS